jgi:LPS export ABC transporter protein LptC
MTDINKHIFLRFAAILTGCFFFQACENDLHEVQALSVKKIGVNEATNIVSYLSLGGVMKAKLTAPLMLTTEADTPKIEFPKTLHVDFYDDSTKIESQLFAKYGRYLENQDKVYLRDSVVVFNKKGDTLRTNELYWDRNLQTFYTDKEVFIHEHSPEQYIHGFGLNAKQDFSDYTITNLLPGSGSFINVPDSSAPH